MVLSILSSHRTRRSADSPSQACLGRAPRAKNRTGRPVLSTLTSFLFFPLSLSPTARPFYLTPGHLTTFFLPLCVYVVNTASVGGLAPTRPKLTLRTCPQAGSHWGNPPMARAKRAVSLCPGAGWVKLCYPPVIIIIMINQDQERPSTSN